MAHKVPTELASGSEDLEMLSHSDTGVYTPTTTWKPIRIKAVFAGVACLAACIGCALFLGAQSGERNSVRNLLESSEMVEESTRNTMATMKGIKPDEEDFVRNTVAKAFQDITGHIKESNPEMFKKLESTTLDSAQKERALKAVAAMRDPRVQQIGYEIAKSIHESKNGGRSAVKQRLLKDFGHRAPELRALKSELYNVAPVAIKSFNPDHMALVKAVPESATRRLENTTGSEFTEADMAASAAKFEKGLGIFASMIEESRVCLDNIDFVGDAFGHDMKIPYWAKSMVGGLDFVTELSDCVMRTQDNQVKLMMCPMKYASAFADFMEGIDNMVGMSNDHMSMFGGDSSTGSSTGNTITSAVGMGSTGWGVTTASPATAGWGTTA